MTTTQVHLRISTNTSTRREFIALLEARITEGWCKSPVTLRPVSIGSLIHRFTYTLDERGHIEIGLREVEDGSLIGSYVQACFELDREFTEAEQSGVWSSFYAQAQPIAASLGIDAEVSHLKLHLRDLFDFSEMALLERINRFRDVSLTALYDTKDWYAFVIEMHRKEAQVDADDICAWLMSKGWDEQVAGMLARDYRYGRALLKQFEVHSLSALP